MIISKEVNNQGKDKYRKESDKFTKQQNNLFSAKINRRIQSRSLYVECNTHWVLGIWANEL